MITAIEQNSAQNFSQKEKANQMIAWLNEYAKKRINSIEMRERRTIPPHIILDFGNRGLMGLQVPITAGGLGLNHEEMLRIIMHIGVIDTTLANFVGLQNTLFLRGLLRLKDSNINIEKYLPDIASGRILGAFAMSEASSGSNPQEILATAGDLTYLPESVTL